MLCVFILKVIMVNYLFEGDVIYMIDVGVWICNLVEVVLLMDEVDVDLCLIEV